MSSYTTQMAQAVVQAHQQLGTTVSVTIAHRATRSGMATVYGPLTIPRFRDVSERELSMAGLVGDDRPTVLRGDKWVLVSASDVTWTPTTYDEVIESSGTRWRVQAITGGIGHPFWRFQVRRNPQE